MTDLSFIPECFIDTNLAETLLGGVGVNHQKGCGTVSSRMKDKFADGFAVGLLDKDKQQVEYLKEFSEVSSTEHLILFKHPQKHHYIIQVVPAMERFILNAMAEVDLLPEESGLPIDFNRFKKMAKTVNSKDEPTFKKLFKKLVREEAGQIILLKSWLNYLKENRYDANIDDLIAFNI